MSETVYNDPQLALNRIYTRGGDAGETSLVNGRRVGKDDLRIESYGTVDELNSVLGLARVSVAEGMGAAPGLARLDAILLRVQHELFNLGSLLATDPGELHPKQPRVRQAEIDQLEREIDECNADLPKLRSFVLPGGCRLNAELHLARTVCRRVERTLVALARREEVPGEVLGYINRLSDALFVWSRWACTQLAVPETLWEPNRAASAVNNQNS
ncbi:MAG: cob(I)yrinic acid a,c-diamide adenosyltransferase [Acidobacteria bacterium]|nr:cob(I)yrinic acid a,c-diamide adenosyltransferase [Acidobacteriota bacterium]